MPERRPEGCITSLSKRKARSRYPTSGTPKSRFRPSGRRWCRFSPCWGLISPVHNIIEGWGSPGRGRGREDARPPPGFRADADVRRCYQRGQRGIREPVPLEYSIGWLTCTLADRPDTVMVSWAGAAHDRLRAGLPDTRPGCRAVPRPPGDSGPSAGAAAVRENLDLLSPVTAPDDAAEDERTEGAEDGIREGPEHEHRGCPLPHRAQAMNLQVSRADSVSAPPDGCGTLLPACNGQRTPL